MKKTVSVLAAVAVMAGATVAMAANGDSNIANSKHNIPTTIGGGTTTQICVYCHTPHNAKESIPLWNRQNGNAANTFTLYSSQTMANVAVKRGFTTDSISLFCMSCHDGSPMGGTMVVNQPKSSGTTTSNSVQTASTNLGRDLSKTHPVNFNMTSEGQPRNNGNSTDLVWTSGNTYMGRAATGIGSYPLFKSARGTYTVECSSCHSVHDDYFNPFLRSTMLGSALCLGCHNK
jgi:predicted CXXCH cytochrome family protein